MITVGLTIGMGSGSPTRATMLATSIISTGSAFVSAR